mgnify:CR=1 FL=1
MHLRLLSDFRSGSASPAGTKYPNMFMFIRSTTLSTERIKYRVAFFSVTMVFALILLSAIIIQNMIA